MLFVLMTSCLWLVLRTMLCWPAAVEARAPINASGLHHRMVPPVHNQGGRGAPRGAFTFLILIIPHGTSRGAPLKTLCRPSISRLWGHPVGTRVQQTRVVTKGLVGTLGHPASKRVALVWFCHQDLMQYHPFLRFKR